MWSIKGKNKIKPYNGTFAFKSDIGMVRINNEDQAKVLVNASKDVLMLVCDGMGGHNKGDYASSTAVSHFEDLFFAKNKFFSIHFAKLWLTQVISQCNKIIYNEADCFPMYKGMGTTLVAAFIRKNKLIVLNVGDSRCYSYTDATIHQLSEDQSYVNYLMKTGEISETEANNHPDKNILMNALGIYPSVNYTITVYPYKGENILLCSDGLTNNISEKEMFSILKTDDTTAQKVDSLIRIANNNGGSDNIAISLWEVNHD